MEITRGTSQIEDDWSKIQTAIASLSDVTLDDCVKRLNESVFKTLSKSAKVEESKNEISTETFDTIMSEIDAEVKTQHVDKQKENKNKKKRKYSYVGQESRQYISNPVIYLCIFPIVSIDK